MTSRELCSPRRYAAQLAGLLFCLIFLSNLASAQFSVVQNGPLAGNCRTPALGLDMLNNVLYTCGKTGPNTSPQWSSVGGLAGFDVNGNPISSPNFILGTGGSTPPLDAGYGAVTWKVQGSNIIGEVAAGTLTVGAGLSISGGGVLLPGGTVNISCPGCGGTISGSGAQFQLVIWNGTAVVTGYTGLTTDASGNLIANSYSIPGTGVFRIHGPSQTCDTPSTSDIYLEFCGGTAQLSNGTAGFFPLLTAAGISGSTVNSGFVAIGNLDPILFSTFLQTSNATGNLPGVASADATLASALAGTVVCDDGNGNLTTGTGSVTCATSGGASTTLGNVSGVTAFASNLPFAAGFGTISTVAGQDLILSAGAGAGVQVSAGGPALPGFKIIGDGTNNGWYQPGAGVWCYETGGTVAKFCFKSTTGFVLANPIGFGISSTTQSTGTPDICLMRVSSNLFGMGSTCSVTDFTGSLKLTNLTVLGSCTGCGTSSLPAAIIFIPAGSSSATVQAFFTGASAGSTIWMTGGYAACGLTLSQAGVTLQGLNWNSTTLQCATAASPVLTVSGTGDVIRGITAQHITNSPTSGGDGIVVTPGTSRVRIEATRANFNYNGYNLGYTDYGWFNSNLSELNNNHGVKITPTAGHPVYQWQFSQNLLQQNLGNGFDFTLGAGITSLQATCPFFSDWNTAFGNAGYGYNVSGSAATTSGIADCWFSGAMASDNNNSGIHLDPGPNGGRNEQVTGGYFEQAGLYTGPAGFAQATQTASNVGYGIEITSSCDSTTSPNITGAILWQNSYSGGISACPSTLWSSISAYANGHASASVQTEAGITVNADNTQITAANLKIASTQTAGVYVLGGDYPSIVGINCLGANSPCVTVGSQPTHGFLETLGNVAYHQQNAAPSGACNNGDVWTRTDTTGGIYLCVNGAWVAH